MGILPVPVIRRQFPPRRPGAQYPEHCIQKQTAVLSRPTSLAGPPAKEASTAPKLVRNIVKTMRRCHTPPPTLTPSHPIYHHNYDIDDTP